MEWLINLIKVLFDAFKNEAPKKIDAPKEEAKKSDGRKKIAIIIGHGNGDGGASTWNGSNEFAYNSKVAEIVKKEVENHTIETFYRGSTGIVGVAAKAVLWKPDISIELHLNSYNGIAIGCEVLVLKNDEESAKLARSFASSFCTKFSRKMRGNKGVKWLASGDRGAASLKALSPIKQSILVESFFADNPSEWVPVENYSKFLTDWIDSL